MFRLIALILIALTIAFCHDAEAQNNWKKWNHTQSLANATDWYKAKPQVQVQQPNNFVWGNMPVYTPPKIQLPQRSTITVGGRTYRCVTRGRNTTCR